MALSTRITNAEIVGGNSLFFFWRITFALFIVLNKHLQEALNTIGQDRHSCNLLILILIF